MLRFVLLLALALGCSTDPPPTASHSSARGKAGSDDLFDIMISGEFTAQDTEQTPSDTTTTDTTAVEEGQEEDDLAADLNGDGIVDEEELAEIGEFQEACKEIAASIVYVMPDVLANQSSQAKKFYGPQSGNVTSSWGKTLSFNGYSFSGKYKVDGPITLTTLPTRGQFSVKRVGSNLQHSYLIGTSLVIKVDGRKISIYGDFADIGKPAIISATNPILISIRYALLTAFDNFDKTVRGEGGGTLRVSGNETGIWAFGSFAPSASRNVKLSGTIRNIDLNNQQFPVRVRGFLNVELSPSIARGKVVGVPLGGITSEPDIDRTGLLSIDSIPSTINPLTSIRVYINVELHQQRTVGTLQIASGKTWDIGELSADPPLRPAFYVMPVTSREELINP